jgi:hypothetical protein
MHLPEEMIRTVTTDVLHVMISVFRTVYGRVGWVFGCG